MPQKARPDIVVRTATPEDGLVAGPICFNAFSAISAAHGFPCDLPGPEAAIGLLSMMFSSPGFYCVVAEHDGRIVGSNCLDERSLIRGIGPITIDPNAQNLGVGRKLMQAAMDRANEQGAAGVRLVQAAFHNRSLSLYTSLGFDIREPLSCLQGQPLQQTIPGCTVRPAKPEDVNDCNALSQRAHGFDRGVDLAEAIEQGTARVVEREDRVTGYTTHLALLRPFHSGDEHRPPGPDRLRRILRRPRNPGAFEEQRSTTLVPGERSASRPAHDPDEHRPL